MKPLIEFRPTLLRLPLIGWLNRSSHHDFRFRIPIVYILGLSSDAVLDELVFSRDAQAFSISPPLISDSALLVDQPFLLPGRLGILISFGHHIPMSALWSHRRNPSFCLKTKFFYASKVKANDIERDNIS